MKMHASAIVPSGFAPRSPQLAELLEAVMQAARSGKAAALVVVWHPSEAIGALTRDGAAQVIEMHLGPSPFAKPTAVECY